MCTPVSNTCSLGIRLFLLPFFGGGTWSCFWFSMCFLNVCLCRFMYCHIYISICINIFSVENTQLLFNVYVCSHELAAALYVFFMLMFRSLICSFFPFDFFFRFHLLFSMHRIWYCFTTSLQVFYVFFLLVLLAAAAASLILSLNAPEAYNFCTDVCRKYTFTQKPYTYSSTYTHTHIYNIRLEYIPFHMYNESVCNIDFTLFLCYHSIALHFFASLFLLGFFSRFSLRLSISLARSFSRFAISVCCFH